MGYLEQRIELIAALRGSFRKGAPEWEQVIDRATQTNAWFNREHIQLAADAICANFLDSGKLTRWLQQYSLPVKQATVGIVMAGNIPLVGFHDFLCGFLSGHRILIKPSKKDETLMGYVLEKVIAAAPELSGQLQLAERLNGCDAYIATGSNNSARYFEQYFAHCPHLIRHNRTSVAVLDGMETPTELELLADDIFEYYGLGCRNITQICVPEQYDFAPLLEALKRYAHYVNFHKYQNNYDYHLAVYLLNKVPYLTNGNVLLVESNVPFSAVSVLHYRYYTDKAALTAELESSGEIQGIAGHDFLQFGSLQRPGLNDYADGADTMSFLCRL